MPVYAVNAYDIHDFETFKQYPPKVRPLLLKYGAKVLAMETNPKALGGKPKTMNAVIEFPSKKRSISSTTIRSIRRSFI